MLFQTLDDKKECIGIYSNGRLYFDDFPTSLARTWGYSQGYSPLGVEYAQIYSNGSQLEQVCPEHLKEDYEKISKKMRAFIKSFNLSGVSLQENCFFDLVPKRFLLEFCEVKNQISEWVFQNYDRPKNHDFMVKVSEMTSDISSQVFELNKTSLNSRLAETRVLSFRNKINSHMRVNYNPFGTVTGRLTTHKGSFPILTLDKTFRSVVQSTKGTLVEIDFNAAELRTLLGLSGTPQPEEDLHLWNVQNIYNDEISRDEAKEKIFSWLYNPKALDIKAEKYYSRDKLVERYFDGTSVKTPMGRTIESEKRTALNYLIQSTSSDIFLNSAYEVWKMLKDRSSEIRFLVHDSILLDLSDEDRDMLPEIIEKFSKTPLGEYKVGVSVGKNYGDMRKVK